MSCVLFCTSRIHVKLVSVFYISYITAEDAEINELIKQNAIEKAVGRKRQRVDFVAIHIRT